MPEYSVSGPFSFRGHEPGSTFTATADEQIRRALNRGSIARAEEKAPPKSTTPPDSKTASTGGTEKKEKQK